MNNRLVHLGFIIIGFFWPLQLLLSVPLTLVLLTISYLLLITTPLGQLVLALERTSISLLNKSLLAIIYYGLVTPISFIRTAGRMLRPSIKSTWLDEEGSKVTFDSKRSF